MVPWILEGAYFATNLVDCPRYIAANLGNCPRDFVEATRDQHFDMLDCLREGSGAGGFVEGVKMGAMLFNSGDEYGQTPKNLFELGL